MPKIFKVPFAVTGDKISPPDAVQSDGSVSYSQGYGFDYQRKTDGTDPLAKVFPREQHNGILNDITTALGEAQIQGLSSWQSAGGPYPINALVRHLGLNWRSTTANNTDEPGSGGSSWVDAVSQPQATESSAGVAMIATAAEVSSGSNDSKIVTPRKLKTSLDLKANLDSPSLVRPSTNTDLPAGDESSSIPNTRFISAAFRRIVVQATEAVSGILRVATNAETISGSSDSLAITPKKLRLGVAYSAARNGYISLPTWLGGFILQWGYASSSLSTTDYKGFNTPFVTECLGISITLEAATPGGYAVNSGVVTQIIDRAKFIWFAPGVQGVGYCYWWAWGK